LRATKAAQTVASLERKAAQVRLLDASFNLATAPVGMLQWPHL